MRRPAAHRLLDLLLLLAALWLLAGPRGPVRHRVEGWLDAREDRRRVADRWEELASPGATLGPRGGGAAHLVVFTDYRCPFCRVAQEEVDALLARRPELRVRVRHLPLPRLHPDAPRLARISVCAEGDPTWPELHRALHHTPADTGGGRTEANDAALAVHLADVGAASPAALFRCAATPRARERVDLDARLATALGIRATPTFVVPGGVHVGALSADSLERILGPPDR